MSNNVEYALESYFIDGDDQEHILENKRKTMAFIVENIGTLSLIDDKGRHEWRASLLGGQNLGEACLAAYYLTSASKLPVRFDANGTRFLFSEITETRN